MNYEQKYKEAIERCKSWMKGEHPECFTEAQKAGEFIFPELRESEDERIRKEIIQSIKDNMCVIHKDKCIAWLEKQGEQKPYLKPSEEQMEALKKRTHGLHTSSETRKALESLINDLKKL